MKAEVIKRLRHDIPEEHRVTDDARIEWLWNQRTAVVQSIFMNTRNIRDKMAATLVLTATLSANLQSIELVLLRLEGGSKSDQAVLEDDSLPI